MFKSILKSTSKAGGASKAATAAAAAELSADDDELEPADAAGGSTKKISITSRTADQEEEDSTLQQPQQQSKTTSKNHKNKNKNKQKKDNKNNKNQLANSSALHEDDDKDQEQDGGDNDDDEEDDDDDGYEKGSKICLPEEECDLPTFLHTENCDQKLIEETRRLLKKRYAKNPQSFYDTDYQRMLNDDWTVTRFLLRRRLHPKRTAKLMEECGRFRKQYRMSELELWEFPLEFLKPAGLFHYARDRVGNVTVYMRVKMYRRAPEVTELFKSFMMCVLEESDKANKGRGTAVIFDLTGCGIQNVDLSFLSWLLSSFRNYCPKGVGYIMVYNLPWMLNATCKLAMTWMSASNRRALRFVQGDEIENFIAKENLPAYLGGTCALDYKAVPKGAKWAADIKDRLQLSHEQVIRLEQLFKDCEARHN